MKKFKSSKLLFSIALLLILTACVRYPQAKPLKPKASSIFKKGNVEQVQVTVDNAYIRNGNSRKFPVITTVKKDDILDVGGLVGKWYIIVLDDGKVGAVNPEDVKPIVEKPSLKGQQANIKQLTPNEQEMVRLVNAERSKNGLNPLKVDLELAEVARFKSQDMIDNDYFSHYSPTYGSPFEMLKNFGVKYIYGGENIAGNPTVKAAHESLMDSEGHRKNILNPNFTHIGVGVKENSKFGKIFTQIFVGR
ncbi:CAP domain-containing protein [Wukongibacter sp. M2B1]|uniref:CAP domain-containing protein n=1 Tax=Wukongibacter sp. M2B1 TaxID=3088895 RepID=UPI003D7BC74E